QPFPHREYLEVFFRYDFLLRRGGSYLTDLLVARVRVRSRDSPPPRPSCPARSGARAPQADRPAAALRGRHGRRPRAARAPLSAAGRLERFVPLDVSEEVLRASAEAIAERYPSIGVHGIVGDFERHLAAIPAGDERVIAFLGSTVGNLYPARRAKLFQAIASA